MIINKTGYTYNDLTIIPSTTSGINSRKECDVYYQDGYLPIFTAPMSAVVNENNFECFEDVDICPVLPTTVDFEKRLQLLLEGKWCAFSMKEANDLISDTFLDSVKTPTYRPSSYKICIDVANGHMTKLIDLAKDLREFFSENNLKLTIMAGNVANPEVLKFYDGVIDLARVGIGGGSGCTTTSNTGIHYPLASLVSDCREFIQKNNLNVKLIADGGIRNYSDVNKALALGADYVMIGGLLTQMIEAASQEFNQDGLLINLSTTLDKFNMSSDNEKKKRMLIDSKSVYHEIYGMSTKRAQQERGLHCIKTSEGTSHKYLVKYTLTQWSKNMKDYMKSAMSYCDCKNLFEFIGNVNLIPNSSLTVNSINK